MKNLRFALAVFAAASMFSMTGAAASTIGIAVDGNNSSTTVGAATTINSGTDRADLAAFAGVSANDVIGYFIPLSSGGTCTYGACGISADTGTGGTLMSMWLKFGNVDGGQSNLRLSFEDLDLPGANDPTGFFEYLSVFDTGGTKIADFDNITNPGVTGTKATQQVAALSLGTLVANQDYWIKLDFSAKSSFYGKNTPEYLVAEIAAVPIPAAGFLLLGGLGGLAALRRRKKS